MSDLGCGFAASIEKIDDCRLSTDDKKAAKRLPNDE